MLGGLVARKPRVQFPGAFYHVISRGNQTQAIYKDDDDHRRFQALLSEVVKRYSITLQSDEKWAGSVLRKQRNI